MNGLVDLHTHTKTVRVTPKLVSVLSIVLHLDPAAFLEQLALSGWRHVKFSVGALAVAAP